jgi:hypothetical protein
LIGQLGDFVKRDLFSAAPAFGILVLARMVYQNVSHYLGRHRKKVRSILPLYVLLIHEFNVGLINESRSLQSVIASLSSHETARQSAQLGFNHRDQPIEGVSITLVPAQ